MLPDKFVWNSTWADYPLCFEGVAAINHWSDDEKVMFQVYHVQGVAQEILENLTPEVRKDYSAILVAIEQRLEQQPRCQYIVLNSRCGFGAAANP